MANTKFVPDRAGFRAMAVSGEVRAAVLAEAEKAKVIAEGLSAPITKTGEYAGSFEVHTTTQPLNTRFGEHEVAVGILENTSGHAAAVEWGSSHDRKPHRILGRTLDGLEHG